MLPDRVSNPGLLTYESGVLPIALRGPALDERTCSEHVCDPRLLCKQLRVRLLVAILQQLKFIHTKLWA